MERQDYTFSIVFRRRVAAMIYGCMCDGMWEVARDDDEHHRADCLVTLGKAMDEAQERAGNAESLSVILPYWLYDVAHDVLENCADNSDEYFKPWRCDPSDPDFDEESAATFLFAGDVEIGALEVEP